MDILLEVLKILAGSGVLLAAWQLFAKVLNDRGNAKASQAFRDISEVFHVLSTLVAGTGAVRALVLKLENGGGVPNAMGTVRSTILYEHTSGRHRSLKDSWDHQVIQAGYAQKISELLDSKDGHVVFTPPETAEAITNLYAANGITHSHVYIVRRTPRRIIYLSLNFTREDRNLSHAESDAIRVALGKLKAISKRSENIFTF